jgi:hypothetical protein
MQLGAFVPSPHPCAAHTLAPPCPGRTPPPPPPPPHLQHCHEVVEQVLRRAGGELALEVVVGAHDLDQLVRQVVLTPRAAVHHHARPHLFGRGVFEGDERRHGVSGGAARGWAQHATRGARTAALVHGLCSPPPARARPLPPHRRRRHRQVGDDHPIGPHEAHVEAHRLAVLVADAPQDLVRTLGGQLLRGGRGEGGATAAQTRHGPRTSPSCCCACCARCFPGPADATPTAEPAAHRTCLRSASGIASAAWGSLGLGNSMRIFIESSWGKVGGGRGPGGQCGPSRGGYRGGAWCRPTAAPERLPVWDPRRRPPTLYAGCGAPERSSKRLPAHSAVK